MLIYVISVGPKNDTSYFLSAFPKKDSIMPLNLVCSNCSRKYPDNKIVWRCDCGGLLDIEYRAELPIDTIGTRYPDMWRYREALPVRDDSSVVSFSEGFTPLVKQSYSGREAHLKLDFLFPTGSFKDRGASLLISKVKELGIGHIVEDSSGNAGAAIAAYAAKADIQCDIFVPAAASGAKAEQIRAYGARVHEIDGTREDVAEAALNAAEKSYYASHSWNPFFFQGTKTIAYEITEQLGWRIPDALVVPVGNGTLLLGAYIGFSDIVTAGIAERLPRLIAVQASRCSPLHRAFHDGSMEFSRDCRETTIAEGIAVAEPVRKKQILDAVQESGGTFITVEEYEITAACEESALNGLYIEPTAAAGIAGLKKFLSDASPEGTIVGVVTGHGLKKQHTRSVLA